MSSFLRPIPAINCDSASTSYTGASNATLPITRIQLKISGQSNISQPPNLAYLTYAGYSSNEDDSGSDSAQSQENSFDFDFEPFELPFESHLQGENMLPTFLQHTVYVTKCYHVNQTFFPMQNMLTLETQFGSANVVKLVCYTKRAP